MGFIALVINEINCMLARLALTSVLGPFGVHLLKFILRTPVH